MSLKLRALITCDHYGCKEQVETWVEPTVVDVVDELVLTDDFAVAEKGWKLRSQPDRETGRFYRRWLCPGHSGHVDF